MVQFRRILEIERLQFLEEKYGITDLNLYAYQLKENLTVVGEIFGESLNCNVKFLCSAFNKDGEIIGAGENIDFNSHSGLVKIAIQADNFRGIHAFKISERIPEGENVSRIRVYPKKS